MLDEGRWAVSLCAFKLSVHDSNRHKQAHVLLLLKLIRPQSAHRPRRRFRSTSTQTFRVKKKEETLTPPVEQ
jgi:hypothetical protein